MTDCERLRARGRWAEDEALGRCAPPFGPRNTWSNLAYSATGLALARLVDGDAATVFGNALVVLGAGSLLYHCYKATWANLLDRFAMYLVLGALAVYGIAPADPAMPTIMVATGVGAGVLFNYAIPKVSLDVQTGVFMYFGLVAAYLRGDRTLAAIALGLFVLAFVLWNLDKRKAPIVGLYGHAAWHVLTAVAFPLLFLAIARGAL